MIEANSIYEKKIKIPKEKFKLRTSGYGIVINNDKILVVSSKSSGKYFFPGGGVEIGEKIKEAISREVWEEAGIKIKIDEFFTFKENFFYYDPDDTAFQSYLFFYKCKPLSLKLTEENQPEPEETGKPNWIKIKDLKSNDFQYPVDEIFEELIKSRDVN